MVGAAVEEGRYQVQRLSLRMQAMEEQLHGAGLAGGEGGGLVGAVERLAALQDTQGRQGTELVTLQGQMQGQAEAGVALGRRLDELSGALALAEGTARGALQQHKELCAVMLEEAAVAAAARSSQLGASLRAELDALDGRLTRDVEQQRAEDELQRREREREWRETAERAACAAAAESQGALHTLEGRVLRLEGRSDSRFRELQREVEVRVEGAEHEVAERLQAAVEEVEHAVVSARRPAALAASQICPARQPTAVTGR